MNSDLNIIPLFFESNNDFRKWLEENHQTKTELLVGYYKVNSGKPSMKWAESVDEAICFGWIDGIRKSVDEESYSIRFTPRNPKSNWSALNIKKVEEMISLGKMTPAGMVVYEKRTEDRTAIYSYENRPEKLDAEMEKQFREHLEAWQFFKQQAPSYKKMMFYWVMSAKQETTQLSRLEKLITASESGKRVL